MTIASPPTATPDAPAAAKKQRLAPWRSLILPVFVILLILGTIGVVMRFAFGHLPAGYGSYVPWGLWIAVYFHAIGIAAGAFGITAVLYLFGVPGFRSPTSLRIAAIIAAASVGSGLLAVALDLGHMFRAYRIIIDPSFTSMMAFNSWSYFALLAVCAIVWVLSYRPDRGWLKPFLVLGLVLSLMVSSQSGAFFGVVGTNRFWHSPLLPIMTMVSAVIIGAAVLMIVRAILGDGKWGGVQDTPDNALDAIRFLRIVIIVGIIAYFVMEFAELSVALWDPQTSAPEIALLLTGPYWWVFWVVHVLLSGIVPLVALANRRPVLWVGAALLLSVTMISSRLNVLIPGQSVEDLAGLQDAFNHPRLTFVYVPTLMEYLVAMFCFALSIAVVYIGLRVTATVTNRSANQNSRKELTNVSD